MDMIAAASLDMEAVRADFPILAQEINGKPLTYLDNAASAQKPRAVMDRLEQAYLKDYANVHRGLHTLANRSTEAYEGAREIVRRHLNAPSAEEVIFTRSSTEGINLVADTFGRQNIGEGDEIVLTVMEHHSNIVPWHMLRTEKGAVLKWVELGRDGAFDLNAFEAALSPRTKMVAITHMSNVLGTVTPVAEVSRIAHARGIPVLVDGSQSAVHGPVDVQALDCDFFVFTGHKLYGPSGIGVLYGKRAHLEAMPPFMGGGEMIVSVTKDEVVYAGLPNRFEPGTPPIAQAIGLGAAIEYVEGLGWDDVIAHEKDLAAYMRERLRGINALTVYG
ncbi:MAG: aminotransferase class V-fold PLP-dependent enzyme, partial [Pseudomonadota bacterium]